ncbi:ricin B-like lectin R40C1 [Oryza sativa Japonica Group]|uniref:ricin B-like lectin R40C1 n=1 Tax=Oryza sativa subsp. japonica TaxID=39947 RepID=UPI000E1B92B8|nr:ricin B-like lectin R40G2 [Oryza sativa Japonica Group]
MAHMFRIQCRASDVLRLTIVNGEVILGKSDPRDDRQVWHKDAKYSAGIKDEAGRPAFALVNKATGDALKHSLGYCCPFEPGYLDESVLWTASVDVADGYRRIHMMNNADYIFDAEEDTPQYGGARDGTRLILFRWNEGLNQIWRMVPCGGGVLEHEKPLRVVCHSNQALFLSVRDGVVVLADIDIKSRRQWIVSFQNTGRVTDAEGHRSFVLVNWSSGKVMKRSGDGEPVELVGHSLDSVDVALLWTRGDDLGEEFNCIRTVSDVGLVLDAAGGVPEFGGAHDCTQIIVFPCHGGANQRWSMLPLD